MTNKKKRTVSTSKNFKTRNWFITINNPIDKDFTHEKIKEIIENCCGSCVYWCMSDEIGSKESTPHTHIFIIFRNPIAFTSMQGKFRGAHFDAVKGQPSQVRDYILKGGKWEHHEKADTKVDGTFEEFGTCPKNRQGERTDLNYLYEQIEKGASTSDIVNENPKYMLRMTEIERVRQMLLEDKYKNTFRHLDVTYIWGDSGTGKTRGVMEKYGYENVFRVTNYDAHPFDNYKGQDVLVLEEFRSSFRLQDMLNYLDGYPFQLPCRYADKVACYTKVYIITNIPFDEQYKNLQNTEKATWEAFKRRIHHFEEYTKVSDTEVEITRTEAHDYYEAKRLEVLKVLEELAENLRPSA